MNTEKVFTAFNKDGKELLLFRTSNNIFIDLIKDKEYPKEKIDLTTLSIITNSIDLRKYMLKKCIINKYKKDREKLLNTKKILIGYKVSVTDYKNWYTGKGIYNMIKHHKWEEKFQYYDLYKYLDEKKVSFDTILNIYCDLNNDRFLGYSKDNEPDKIYEIPDFKNGTEYVITIESLFNEVQETYLNKKTINEMAYKLRKIYY